MPLRCAFVTIGQTPRDDLVPEMVGWIGDGAVVSEFGALDGLSHAEVAALAPVGDEHRLVTRLRDGGEAVVGKAATERRLQDLFTRIDDGFDVIVLLCTGSFGAFATKTLFVEAQAVVDATTRALAHGAGEVGVMVPLAAQVAEFHALDDVPVRLAHASPYSGNRLAAAADDLRSCAFITLHCMGYTDAMRRTVARASGRPVLLSRKIVAGTVAQLI